MEELNEEKLNNISGGGSITGPIINAVGNLIGMIRDAGYSLGSGIRRLSDNNLCPLK